MIPWEILGRAVRSEGDELTLHHRGGEFVIRVGGRELMSSRVHYSEEEMARLAVKRLGARQNIRLLIGGLGMGFTLRAALDALPPQSSVTVAEIEPEVVAWNQGPLADLAGRPLEDRRAHIVVKDVSQVISDEKIGFDAILLDVDNGPEGLALKSNSALYSDSGLLRARSALRPGGLFAVWSASPDATFLKRLQRAGFSSEAMRIRQRSSRTKGTHHTIFFGILR